MVIIWSMAQTWPAGKSPRKKMVWMFPCHRKIKPDGNTGWWFFATPLKNIWSSSQLGWFDYSQNMKSHVKFHGSSHHQPEILDDLTHWKLLRENFPLMELRKHPKLWLQFAILYYYHQRQLSSQTSELRTNVQGSSHHAIIMLWQLIIQSSNVHRSPCGNLT